jgi:hypothetical protein
MRPALTLFTALLLAPPTALHAADELLQRRIKSTHSREP